MDKRAFDKDGAEASPWTIDKLESDPGAAVHESPFYPLSEFKVLLNTSRPRSPRVLQYSILTAPTVHRIMW